jgi:acetyltransferase-like isoleucine patch superfamily enzyme
MTDLPAGAPSLYGSRSVIGLARRAGGFARAAAALRRRRVRFGPFPAVYGKSPQLNVKGSMSVGGRFNVRGEQFPVQITVREGGRLQLGDRVFLNQGVNILVASQMIIGDDCKIGDLAAIRDTDTHEVQPGEGAKTSPVVLERNVWVGRSALIMPGTRIGENAVIAAGAVVTKDVPANSVAAGVPASIVKTFDTPPSGWVRK